MQRFFLTAALVLAAGLVNAQFDPEPKYDSGAVTAVVDRVHTDLNHAYGTFHFSNADRDRLNKAEKELREFAKKWDHGKFDKGQLNDSIESVQKVLNSNKLPADDRSSLDADISQLRRMREAYEHHEIK
jgi:hypothetical protein